ncbi:MAG: two-component regulator propeller domain-containing protein [Saprospiraceae bacterium]
MQKNQPYLIIFLYLLLFTFGSCNAQEEKSTRESITILETEDISNQSDDTYIDPIFFIEGQLCQHLRKIFEDQKGNLWFGTNNYGMMKYDGDSLVYLSEVDGEDIGRVTEIFDDKSGNVWFGHYGGIAKFDGSNFKNYSEEDGLIYHEVWSVAKDRKGIMWIGTSEGVSRFDGKTFTDFPIPKAVVPDTTSMISYNRVSEIMEDRHGTLWFGTDGFGICKYDGKEFSQLTTANGLPDNNVGDLMEDSKGNIWIGTMYGGLSFIAAEETHKKNPTFINYTKDGIIEGVEVGSFYEDKKGNFWFAAENHGVYRYDGNTFTNLYKEAGLLTNGILCILEDSKDRFWFGGWGGLFRYGFDPGDSYAKEKTFYVVTKEGPF